MRNIILIFIVLAINFSCSRKEPGKNYTLSLDSGWKFLRDSISGPELPGFDDSGWRTIDVPHDYSIEDIPGTASPFDSNAVGGVSTGFTRGGTAWYRKSLTLPDSPLEHNYILQFDGIYMNARIFLNGQLLGEHPYGYTSFWYDITEKLNYRGKNVLAVEVRNEGRNSRWYSGSGIYRHVWLRITGKQHLAQWGTYITTESSDKDSAEIVIKSHLNNSSTTDSDIKMIIRINSSDNKEVASAEAVYNVAKSSAREIEQHLNVRNPDLWSPDNPAMYSAIIKIYAGGHMTDSSVYSFGIRKISFDTENGFLINGQPVKLKGACFHHDNGPLGSKAYDRAEERKIELLKASGFNSIRCSHNPPSSALLDACDRLGILVIDEAFDMWQKQKNPDDYHLYFDEWWQRDIESMVMRDRNHPSVIMWSIGNEIPDRHKPEVVEVAGMLAEYVHGLDPSRPVTSAVNDLKPDKDPYFAVLDIAGYNYASGGDHNQQNLYQKDHARVPDRIMVGTESYPLEAFDAWMDVIDNPYVIGDFVWTGFDYIGEASIGWRCYPQEKNFYPWNLAYCGDIDICGNKRPQSYYRDALWGKNQLALFVKPPDPSFEPNPNRTSWCKWHWHDVVADWNWSGYENSNMEVVAYSSCDEVELFLNGISLGRKESNRSTEFTASWTVPYKAGELKAVGYFQKKKINQALLLTAGEPSRIKLSADRKLIKADGEDLCFVQVEITDNGGILNPKADNLIRFKIEGPATIAGVGNANPVSIESYQLPQRRAWRGRCLVIIKSEQEQGEINLVAEAQGLMAGSVKITTK